MKYAIVDFGSNTVRLSVYDTLENGGFSLLFSEKEMVGIINYIDRDRLSQEGVRKACSVLQKFQNLLRHFGIQEMHVFATASLRNIANTGEVLEEIYRSTGIAVDLIPGDLEAKLGYYGVIADGDWKNGAMFDIGGGSTEILEVENGQICRAESFPIGSLNLFSQYVGHIWPKSKELEQMQKRVRQILTHADLPQKKVEAVCGIGGTARAVLKIANAYYGRDTECRSMTLDELDEIKNLLFKRNRKAQKLILRACPDRIHTILPGLSIMHAVGKTLRCEKIRISKYGVREGYLCHKLVNHTI
ncbi:MAG TPA: hypothetical protein H9671_11185 [Firmicutes bacterium]|nr:hypothetical protein [Bacillota bacterium]